jgi:hypothetical protein
MGPVTSSAGSWPQVSAVKAPVTAFTATVTATESGQRVRNPRRRRPPEQRLSRGRASGTKAEHHLVDSALPDVTRFALLWPIDMLSNVNLVSQSPFWGHILEFWPSRTVLPSPSPGIPLHPRARHYRRYLEVVLLAMLRVYLLPSAHISCRLLPGKIAGSDAAR